MTSKHEEFQAAYRAWRNARQKYDDSLEAMIAGQESFDGDQVQAAIAEFNRLHEEFMVKSKPFVRFR